MQLKLSVERLQLLRVSFTLKISQHVSSVS